MSKTYNSRGGNFLFGALAVCAICAALAATSTGGARFGFGAVAVVAFATAGYCALEVWLNKRGGASTYFEDPSVPNQLPEAPVTEVLNSVPPPNNPLDRSGPQ